MLYLVKMQNEVFQPGRTLVTTSYAELGPSIMLDDYLEKIGLRGCCEDTINIVAARIKKAIGEAVQIVELTIVAGETELYKESDGTVWRGRLPSKFLATTPQVKPVNGSKLKLVVIVSSVLILGGMLLTLVNLV